MMKYRIAVAAGALVATGVAHAGSYSLTPMVATDYDFRGVSQTDPVKQDGKVALQLGGTYNFDNAIYVGAWGSNIDNSYPSAAQGGTGGGKDGDNVEIDVFAGYAWGDASSSFAYDVGLYAYTYPGWNSDNMAEAYVGVSRSIYSAKLWFSPDVASSSKSGVYGELNANIPMGGIDNLTLLLHVGQTFGSGYSGNKAVDFSVGTGYNVDKLRFAVRYVDRTKGTPSRIVASLATTFPWSRD
jgi:uncharacterized protein (TIGR02001 family)